MHTNIYIVKNKRTDDGGFIENFKCDVKLCKHPSTYLVEIWITDLKLTVCGECLNQLQQKINKYISEDIC